MRDLKAMGERAAELLAARGQRVAVAESSAGGLIAASLLAVPGASTYFTSGAVVYTAKALRSLLDLTREDIVGMGLRSSSEPYARFLAKRMRDRSGVEWAVSETGAAGPTGNPYGDPAGHTCIAVSGPIELSRTIRTGSADRVANMWAFTEAALALLVEALESK